MFDPALPASPGDLLAAYDREQALASGRLVSAMTAELASVTRLYFTVPVAMSDEVADVLDRAVEDPRRGNDRPGVWNGICGSLHRKIASLPPPAPPPAPSSTPASLALPSAHLSPWSPTPSPDELFFDVTITGAAPGKYWT